MRETRHRGTRHLIQRGKVYYFRARVPTKLVESYGRSMVSISLETGDEALARERLAVRLDEFNRELAHLGRQTHKLADGYKGTLLHLTDDDLERLCLRYRAAKLAEDEIDRIKGLDAQEHQLDLDVLEAGVAGLRLAYARGDLADVHINLSTFLGTNGLRIPKGTPSYGRLAQRFQLAQIEVYDAILKRRKGVAVDLPQEPVNGLTIDDVFRLWKTWVPNRPLKTVRAFEKAFEELSARTTAPNALALSKKDAVAFRDRLISSQTCSRRTVAKHISFLRAAFECARKDGLVEVNPFDGVEVQLDEIEMKSKARVPFTGDELTVIFSGPAYQRDFKPRKSLGAATRWLPLLSLFHGSRLEEMAQLHVEDIRQHAEHGWYILVHAEGERQVKNSSSVRQVPLHPELIKLGFLQYVKSMKTGRLFPTLRADKYGKLATTFSTWFGRYLTSLGIADPRKVFHSLRHGFVAVCKQKAAAGIPPEVREAIVGHTPTDEIAATYGDVMYPLEPMVAAMRHVAFKGLDLSHLYVTREPEPA